MSKKELRKMAVKAITNGSGGFCLDLIDQETQQAISNWSKLVIEQSVKEPPKVIVTLEGAVTPVELTHEDGRYVPAMWLDQKGVEAMVKLASTGESKERIQS